MLLTVRHSCSFSPPQSYEWLLNSTSCCHVHQHRNRNIAQHIDDTQSWSFETETKITDVSISSYYALITVNVTTMLLLSNLLLFQWERTLVVVKLLGVAICAGVATFLLHGPVRLWEWTSPWTTFSCTACHPPPRNNNYCLSVANLPSLHNSYFVLLCIECIKPHFQHEIGVTVTTLWP